MPLNALFPERGRLREQEPGEPDRADTALYAGGRSALVASVTSLRSSSRFDDERDPEGPRGARWHLRCNLKRMAKGVPG